MKEKDWWDKFWEVREEQNTYNKYKGMSCLFWLVFILATIIIGLLQLR